MFFIEAESCLQPDICCPSVHMLLFLQPFQSMMGKDAFVAQAAVCQSSHGAAIPFVSAHIGIAGRPVGADIEEALAVYGTGAIDGACRSADCRRTAVGAVDVVSSFVFHCSPPLCCVPHRLGHWVEWFSRNSYFRQLRIIALGSSFQRKRYATLHRKHRQLQRCAYLG